MKKIKKVVRWIVNKVLFKVTIYNSEILNSEQSLIICPNHSTLIDGVIMWANHDNIKIIAKQELFKSKLIGDILLQNDVLPIDRKSYGLKAIKESINILKNKGSFTKLIIFPQGTRCFGNVEDSAKKSKKGASFISRSTSVPLLPTYITEGYGVFDAVNIVYGDIYHPKNSSTKHAEMNEDVKIIADEIVKCKKRIKLKK